MSTQGGNYLAVIKVVGVGGGGTNAVNRMTTNQTLLALGGLITLAWLGPQGLRELGETCMGALLTRWFHCASTACS